MALDTNAARAQIDYSCAVCKKKKHKNKKQRKGFLLPGSQKRMAARRLLKEYKQLVEDAPEGIQAGPVDEGDLLRWEALIDGPEGSPYEGGVFRAILEFPPSYPMQPPTMRFVSPVFHPNIGADGKVCISILHAPGDDPLHYESRSERWSAAQSVEKVLLSVMSMLAEPNDESPANVDAGKLWRQDRPRFLQRATESVRKSLGLE